MIDIKHAVRAAETYLKSVFDDPPSIQLEEIYLSDDDASWFVTLSFLAEESEDERSISLLAPYGAIASEMSKALGKRLVRKFRTFEVNRTSGEVRAMKIRPVPSA
jgi:hypothetical protein